VKLTDFEFELKGILLEMGLPTLVIQNEMMVEKWVGVRALGLVIKLERC